MDLIIVKIIDIIISEDKETKAIKTKKVYLPSLIHKKDIEDIHPALAFTGKLYKNISTIKTYSGESHTVVGNYKDINSRINKIEFKSIKGFNHINNDK